MKSKRISSLEGYIKKPWIGVVAVICLVFTCALSVSANPTARPVTRASVQLGGPSAPSAVHLRGAYESSRMTGIVMAGILAPIFGGFTAMGTTLLYRHGREDGGGFCTVITRDSDGDYRRTCEGDRGELAGIILIASIGGILTLAMLITGAAKLSRSSRRLRQLSLNNTEAELSPLKLRFALSEREVSVGFTF